LRSEEDVEAMEDRRTVGQQQNMMQFQHAAAPSVMQAPAEQAALGSSDSGQPTAESNQGEQAAPFVRDDRKIGRNEPCPCGSGKKYKRCHGQLS